MPAPPVQPIVIWFGRVGDMILLSTLLGILHRRYRRPCHLIGAGSWTAEIYAAHSDVARVTCLHRYTAFLFDRAWWAALAALRRSRGQPVYVCEYDPRKLARIQRLLNFSGTNPACCLFITREGLAQPLRRAPKPQTSKNPPSHWIHTPSGSDNPSPQASLDGPRHWVDRLVSFGRLTPPAFAATDYPWVDACSQSDSPRPQAPTIGATKGVDACSQSDSPPPPGSIVASPDGPSLPPVCAPHLEVSAAARAECAAWIERQGWSGRTLVLVQPGNRRTMRGRRLRESPADDKWWPIERWAQLLRQVHARLPEAVIVLCGAPRESLLLGWIAEAVQLAALSAVELPLSRLLALCERAHSMISVDTGPAHAAAALSLPLVVMFGAHSPQEWLPRSPAGSPVVGVGGPPHSRRLDEISVDTVFAAWCSLPARGLKATAASATVR
jgi:ADP-heptose:LPS heptosyltransferase